MIAKPFHRLHAAIKLNDASSFWLKGGRGSTKSSFAAIEIVLGIMRDPEANGLVLRKVGDTIRTSVFQTVLWAIDMLGVDNYFTHTKSPPEITYVPTNQKIIFKGLDDPLKLKSIKMKRGYFKFLWFEEAAEFAGMEEIRSVEQSVLRGGDKFVEFLTYNPPNDPAAWVNAECEKNVDGRIVHESCYLDVPPEWLGEKFIKDAEALLQNDPLKYEHEYMGKAVGRAEQIIFHGKFEILEIQPPENVQFFFGADFGFAKDPNTLVRCWVDNECLYIDYAAFGHGVELDEINDFYDSVPDCRRWIIYADCSRPETISYLSRQGFNIRPAPKWQGSVEDGIQHLKGFKKIYIHPRCKYLIEEFWKYSYKVDRVTQEVLPIIVDAWNHGIDAIRYALAHYIQKRGVGAMWEQLGAE